MPDDVYAHGHHDSVLGSHRWRTGANSAGYLLHLHPGDTLLDVGCGPGTITADLVAAVAPGRVVAIDADLGRIADAWREWGAHPDGWLVLVHGEVLATR
jgi:ubiquinone/menaquinone biosynthesis C-methylase UbiE